MKLETKMHGDITLVRLCETRLDAALSLRFKESMREVADAGADNVVLDLSEVTFMDSSGLGAVVAVMKHLGRERAFRIAGLTPAVDKVFKLTRMDSIFEILASVDDVVDGNMTATG